MSYIGSNWMQACANDKCKVINLKRLIMTKSNTEN